MKLNKIVVASGVISFLMTAKKQKDEIKGDRKGHNFGELLIRSGLGMAAGYFGSKLLKPNQKREEYCDKSNTQQLRDILTLNKKKINCKEECIIEDVTKYLNNVYQDKLEECVLIHGSKAKKLNGVDSDTDLLLKFKENSFPTLKHMAEDVHCEIDTWYGGEKKGIKVRKQRVSTGIILGNKKHQVNIDIVPARRTKNELKEEYNLHKRAMKKGEQPGRIKIDPNIQNQISSSKESTKDVIRLMREYNKRLGKPMKSILVDSLTQRALKDEELIPWRLDDKLLMTMKYFAEHIEKSKIRAVDNSNSVLTDYTTLWQKQCIASNLEKDVHELELGKISFKELFPIR